MANHLYSHLNLLTPAITPIMIHEFEGDIRAPEVWGEAFWFMMHVSATAAPEIIPPAAGEKYWNFIEAIPLLLPCGACAEHARAFIQSQAPYKYNIIATRFNLCTFFVNFHNQVNARSGKPLMSVEDAIRKYSGAAHVRIFGYN